MNPSHEHWWGHLEDQRMRIRAAHEPSLAAKPFNLLLLNIIPNSHVNSSQIPSLVALAWHSLTCFKDELLQLQREKAALAAELAIPSSQTDQRDVVNFRVGKSMQEQGQCANNSKKCRVCIASQHVTARSWPESAILAGCMCSSIRFHFRPWEICHCSCALPSSSRSPKSGQKMSNPKIPKWRSHRHPRRKLRPLSLRPLRGRMSKYVKSTIQEWWVFWDRRRDGLSF